jgi:hypothetical protein
MTVHFVAENEVGDSPVIHLGVTEAMRQKLNASLEVEDTLCRDDVKRAQTIRGAFVIAGMKQEAIQRRIARLVGKQDKRDDNTAIRKRADLPVQGFDVAALSGNGWVQTETPLNSSTNRLVPTGIRAPSTPSRKARKLENNRSRGPSKRGK